MSEQRLERIEQKLDDLARGTVTGLQRLEATADAGLQRLEAGVDAGLHRLEGKVDAGLQRLDQKSDRIQTTLNSIVKTQTNINSELSDNVIAHERRINALEARQP